MSDIVSFYKYGGTNQEGDSLEDIWQWDDQRLERDHNFIQNLFPLNEPSRAQPHSPVLTPTDIADLTNDENFAKKFLVSLNIMLKFYGLEINSDAARNPIIVRADNFLQQRKNWLIYGDHNHLRLTRIMKSLILLGQPQYAIALKNCLLGLASEERACFSATTLDFWQAIKE